MDNTEQKNIRLVVSDEQTLYTPFNPEPEFSSNVKDYIRAKAADENPGQSIRLTVISRDSLDEERFRTASTNWIKEEKALFRTKEKETFRLLIGLLLFASIFIVVSLVLQNRFEVLKYSLLPILGSLSLSRAAGILIIDMPTVKTQRWMINDMENKNVITFEYLHEEITSTDKELV